MKTLHINASNLRNEEHFQLHCEVRELVLRFTPKALRVEHAYEAYALRLDREEAAMVRIPKSSFTAAMGETDMRRDQLFRGMVNACRAALDHFDPKLQEAAQRLKVLLDVYGNVTLRPLNEETAALHNLLQELEGEYAAEVKKLGLGGWLRELQAANRAFAALAQQRYGEQAQHSPATSPRSVRRQVDEAYAALVERVNAQALIEGREVYSEFTRHLNAVLEKYCLLLAQRQAEAAPTRCRTPCRRTRAAPAR